MGLYYFLGHAQHFDPDLPAISLKKCHLKVTGRVHLDVERHEANASPAIASSGSQLAQGRQHAACDGASVVARLLAP